MPRIGGRSLSERVRGLRPLLAEVFVFVTGDRARDEARRFLEECGQPAVMKPYDFNDLISAIGKVAGEKGRPPPAPWGGGWPNAAPPPPAPPPRAPRGAPRGPPASPKRARGWGGAPPPPPYPRTPS